MITSCCTTSAPVLLPPPCPIWSNDAIDDLALLIHMQELGEIDIVALEYQLGENERHCRALDAFLAEE
jgi:hypothetical protein